jgi:hypothetical protein
LHKDKSNCNCQIVFTCQLIFLWRCPEYNQWKPVIPLARSIQEAVRQYWWNSEKLTKKVTDCGDLTGCRFFKIVAPPERLRTSWPSVSRLINPTFTSRLGQTLSEIVTSRRSGPLKGFIGDKKSWNGRVTMKLNNAIWNRCPGSKLEISWTKSIKPTVESLLRMTFLNRQIWNAPSGQLRKIICKSGS